MFENLIYYFRTLLKQPFKVGIISYYYPETHKNMDSGVAIHTYYLSRELAKLGCDVHVFCRGERDLKKITYLNDGKLTVHRIKTDIFPRALDPIAEETGRYLVFENKLINEITRENLHGNFRMIHTHGWLTSGAFIVKSFNDVKWIHTFHSMERNRLKFMSKEEKRFYKIAHWIESTIRYSDALICVSDNVRGEVIPSYPVKEKDVYVVPNGVDLNLFNLENSDSTDKRVLYIGRFSLEKGIDYIPKIIEKVLKIDNKIIFEIVAFYEYPIPSFEKIKNKLDELIKIYPKNIVWHKQKKGREEIAEIIKRASLAIQPSRYEAFGMTVLESMACGKPVICSNRGGLPGVVQNAGESVELETDIFVERVLSLMQNPRLRERYARRGVNIAKELGWEEIARRTLDLYKKVSPEKDKNE